MTIEVWLLIVAIGAIAVCAAVYHFSRRTLERFGARCLSVMPDSEFITPCEIGHRHYNRYGPLTDYCTDIELIRLVFQDMESHQVVLGAEHEPDESCGCDRAFCLKFGMRHTERSAKRPQLKWIPAALPKPV